MRGFTLVEMLVVLVLLAILAALLTAPLRNDDRRAVEQEATRLAGALEHAIASAQWHGDLLGISAEGGAYRFWRRDADGQWHVLTGDDVLAPRAMHEGMLVRPLRYGMAVVAPDAILPFRPSGRNEPRSLVIAARDWSAVIAADPLNRVAWTLARSADANS